MMHFINEALLAVGSSPAASMVAKATFTTALGLSVARLARGSRAAVRHAVLAAAFGVLLLLPIASVVAPPVRIAVTEAAQERVVPASSGASHAIAHLAPARTDDGAIVRQSEGISWSALLFVAWLAGAALFLMPVITGLWQARGLRRSALPWRQGQSVVEGLGFDARFHRRVDVLLHESLQGPMTCGAVHPAIVLPADALTWPQDDLNRAIVHELEHVRRGDWAIHCIARALCAAYWFHPLVWIAWRQLALEAERACDDAVLGRSEATAYADQLIGLARRLSAARKSPALAMANRADLATRVGAVLNGGQRRGRAGTLSVALACAAAAVLVVAIGPLTLIAAPQAVAGDDRALRLPTFVDNTMLVITDVTVKDQNGRAIEGLKPGDFVLTEDGKAQAISFIEFQKLDDTPAQRVLPAVSSYYVLGYYTTNGKLDGVYRRTGITLRDGPNATLDYRAGYYSSKPFEGAGRGAGNGDGNAGNPPDVTAPTLLSRVDPEYSEEARKAKYSGTVVLRVGIDADGRLVDIRVVKSLGMGLDEKAVQAVQKWRFRPGMKGGEPVATQAEVELNFRLL